MIKKILGLDISSSCTGICLLEWNTKTDHIELRELTYYKPTKKGNILERLYDTRNKMADIINRLKPDEIAIEDIITFMPRRSSANTIIMLAVFNRALAMLGFDYIEKAPTLYPVMAIRRGLQLGAEVPKKEDMPDLVSSHLGITFPWEYNRNNKIKSESYDKADALSVALFHTFNLMGKVKTKPASTKKPKEKSKPKAPKKSQSKRKKTKSKNK